MQGGKRTSPGTHSLSVRGLNGAALEESMSITSGDFRHRVTVQTLAEKKRKREPIVSLTAYDYATARLADEAGVDLILVGDSLAQVVLGYDSTLPVTMEEMLHHTRAVRRAVRRAFLVADMPFGSYHTGSRKAVENAVRFVKEGGAEAVKIEGGVSRLPLIHRILDAEIPVVGHIGLTPQSVHRMGGYKVQGKTAAGHRRAAGRRRRARPAPALPRSCWKAFRARSPPASPPRSPPPPSASAPVPTATARSWSSTISPDSPSIPRPSSCAATATPASSSPRPFTPTATTCAAAPFPPTPSPTICRARPHGALAKPAARTRDASGAAGRPQVSAACERPAIRPASHLLRSISARIRLWRLRPESCGARR